MVYEALAHAVREPLVRAVTRGLAAAAVLDRDGTLIARAGDLSDDDIRALAGALTESLKGENLAERLFVGEMIDVSLDDRGALLGIAGRAVFVVAVLGVVPRLTAARNLRVEVEAEVERVLSLTPTVRIVPPSNPDDGGSTSGPAHMPVGAVVMRRRGKA